MPQFTQVHFPIFLYFICLRFILSSNFWILASPPYTVQLSNHFNEETTFHIDNSLVRMEFFPLFDFASIMGLFSK